MKTQKLFLLGSIALCLCFSSCSKNKKASCSDGLKNQNEILTDCGGPCSPCETCSDGILNQNETATDCGGVCSKCVNCNDGIQNGGETGVDCGGPCGICRTYYSEFGSFGYNVLHNDTLKHFKKSVIASPQNPGGNFNYYSLRCKAQEGVRIKVVFTKLSGSGAWQITSPIDHWDYPYNSSNPFGEFSTIGEVTAETRFFFTNDGSAKMQIFEADMNTPVREKIISWN
ncbi:MAG: hypothetical protein JNL60_17545 [Bacteroidia bacterium]|nr:hypothetical protein [Bacteroidia bacterium]